MGALARRRESLSDFRPTPFSRLATARLRVVNRKQYEFVASVLRRAYRNAQSDEERAEIMQAHAYIEAVVGQLCSWNLGHQVAPGQEATTYPWPDDQYKAMLGMGDR